MRSVVIRSIVFSCFCAALTSAPAVHAGDAEDRLPGLSPCAAPCQPADELITHPDNGKALLVREGSVLTQFHYDAHGELTEVSNSEGAHFQLDYDGKKQIRTLRMLSDGRPAQLMRFDYNRSGKPVRIELVGVGLIRVRYDASGEIASVDSPQGARMALQITQTFQSLLSVTRPRCAVRATTANWPGRPRSGL
ncbi:hypothetical protein GCM10025771_41470 [Niveibacterium umoris]|uniref:YD repeat-containing protein n=1 Tax=Niveibacterium umoris TaxID=1193620 RepID=A0A840BQE7_9RHOO|nr:hypothetical protein [Niveibacterium umoris]MBB4014853.1 YD repeat-containing protein [Niveibacterium umoris]